MTPMAAGCPANSSGLILCVPELHQASIQNEGTFWMRARERESGAVSAPDSFVFGRGTGGYLMPMRNSPSPAMYSPLPMKNSPMTVVPSAS